MAQVKCKRALIELVDAYCIAMMGFRVISDDIYDDIYVDMVIEHRHIMCVDGGGVVKSVNELLVAELQAARDCVEIKQKYIEALCRFGLYEWGAFLDDMMERRI